MEGLMNFFKKDEIEQKTKEVWRVMIIDDDENIHAATKYSLTDFSYEDKEIEWISAYSADEAKVYLEHNKDVCLIFLDVVMETDDAGLRFLKWFRSKNINPNTRIILRTGQPGAAPEREIIVNYDLYDYKTKTELTSEKLFTATVAALRSYKDLKKIQDAKEGADKVIKMSRKLFDTKDIHELCYLVLDMTADIMGENISGLVAKRDNDSEHWEIIASRNKISISLDEVFSYFNILGKNEFITNTYLIKVDFEKNCTYGIFLDNCDFVDDMMLNLILLLLGNAESGIKNISLYNELTKYTNTIVMSLAGMTEFRDRETGNHVMRMAKAAERLTKEIMYRNIYPNQVNKKMLDDIGLAATLHDIGKIVTPDNILLKPGKLTEDEFKIMKEHAEAGADILESLMKKTDTNEYVLYLGSRIARGHHEKWNGSGYPLGLSGQDIPIEARIVAILDVFDALIHDRVYKKAFSLMKAKEIISAERGKHFDPLITDVFLDIVEDIYFLD